MLDVDLLVCCSSGVIHERITLSTILAFSNSTLEEYWCEGRFGVFVELDLVLIMTKICDDPPPSFPLTPVLPPKKSNAHHEAELNSEK